MADYKHKQNVRKKRLVKIWSEDVKEREHLKKLCVTVRKILKWVLKIRCERVNFHLADRQSACEQTDFSTKLLNY